MRLTAGFVCILLEANVIEKEILPEGSLTDLVIQDYGRFDEIFGIRKRAVQLFDVVCIDKENSILEFRMDGLDVQRAKDIERRLEFLESKIFKVFESDLILVSFLQVRLICFRQSKNFI
jgi:hypothetical protein